MAAEEIARGPLGRLSWAVLLLAAAPAAAQVEAVSPKAPAGAEAAKPACKPADSVARAAERLADSQAAEPVAAASGEAKATTGAVCGEGADGSGVQPAPETKGFAIRGLRSRATGASAVSSTAVSPARPVVKPREGADTPAPAPSPVLPPSGAPEWPPK